MSRLKLRSSESESPRVPPLVPIGWHTAPPSVHRLPISRQCRTKTASVHTSGLPRPCGLASSVQLRINVNAPPIPALHRQ